MEEIYIKPLEDEIRKLKAVNERYEKLFWNLGTPRPSRRRRKRK
jgi:hypothetical protein